jgi:hypothetical protein
VGSLVTWFPVFCAVLGTEQVFSHGLEEGSQVAKVWVPLEANPELMGRGWGMGSGAGKRVSSSRSPCEQAGRDLDTNSYRSCA